MRRKALITGLTGFTGPYLKSELEKRGYDVFGTTLNQPPSDPKIFRVDMTHKNDVVDLVQKITPDIVAHLAGVSFVPHQDKTQVYLTHIAGTQYLLEALAQQSKRPQHILLASSAHVYGKTASTCPLEETSPLLPRSDYGISKWVLENLAQLWKDKLPLTIVRPFNYTGIGQSPSFLIPKIVRHFVRKEKTIELGATDVLRDFSDVRSVARYYAKLLDEGQPGNTYNVCSGHATSVQEIIDICQSLARYTISIQQNTQFFRSEEIKTLCGSNAKLVSVVGEIEPISLYDTLKWMYEAGL